MKKFLIILFITFFAAFAAMAQTLTPFPEPFSVAALFGWLWANLTVLLGYLTQLIIALEAIARATPTERDNSVLRIIQSWLDKIGSFIGVFRNQRKGSNEPFTAYSKEEDAPVFGALVQK